MSGMNMVGMADYAGFNGGEIGADAQSPEHVNNLLKALSAGTARGGNVGSSTFGDGSALRPESLENTLKTVTFREEMIKKWRSVPKKAAYNTVEEFNLLNEYGGEAGVFTNEGELPQVVDSQFERKTALVKFLGVVGEVTHPMMVVRSAHGDVVRQEVLNKTRHLLRNIEVSLFLGRSDNVTQEWDGFYKQILDGLGISNPVTDMYSATDVIGGNSFASTVVIDARGGPLTEKLIQQAANNTMNNYGEPNTIWGSPTMVSDLTHQIYPRQRFNAPPPVNGRAGFALTELQTTAGVMQLQPDVFLRSGRKHGVKTAPTAATSAKAPNAPTFAAGTIASDATSMFKASDAGDYWWTATAVNRYGESVASGAITGTLAAGEDILHTITDGGGANAATSYRIYRSRKDGGSNGVREYMMEVKRDAATTQYFDRNWFLPRTSFAWMTRDGDEEHHSFRQLTPMSRIPLATIAPALRWMQLLYGTPLMYKPRQNTIFINVQDS